MLHHMLRAAAGNQTPGGGDPYSDAVLSDVPILYWSLQDASAPVSDSAGSHSGSIGSGTTLQQAGIVTGQNYSASFDGTSNAYISTPDANDLKPSGDWTVEVWIVFDAFDGAYPKIAWKPTAPSSGEATYLIQGVGGGALIARTTISGTNYDTPSTGSLVDGAAHLVVAKRAGTTLSLAVDDGTPLTQTLPSTASDVNGLYGLYSGDSGNSYNDPWSGRIASIAYYGYALSDQRRHDHYSIGSGA